jgi:hypothetical protein
MTKENIVLEDKKLSSQKEYLKLLQELHNCFLREEQLATEIKRIGRLAGYAWHEIRCDEMKACKT